MMSDDYYINRFNLFMKHNNWGLESDLSYFRSATQNLAQTRKGKKTASKDFKHFRESA